jgi:hypothetical protein
MVFWLLVIICSVGASVQEATCTINLSNILKPDCLPAAFGSIELKTQGDLVLAEPFDGCSLASPDSVKGKIVFATRGSCGFVTKAEQAQHAGDLRVF